MSWVEHNTYTVKLAGTRRINNLQELSRKLLYKIAQITALPDHVPSAQAAPKKKKLKSSIFRAGVWSGAGANRNRTDSPRASCRGAAALPHKPEGLQLPETSCSADFTSQGAR
jgi:hypothetical protein